VKDKMLEVFKQKYENFVENIGIMDEIFDGLDRNEMKNYGYIGRLTAWGQQQREQAEALME
jgi:hypothetical protein